jgi:hypothetical protein
MTLVGQHCSMLRSNDLEGFLVSSSYEATGTFTHFLPK